MQKEDCFFLGHISRTHGQNGALVAHLDTDRPEQYSKLESILLEVGSGLVPFFIRNISSYKNNQVLLVFEDVAKEEAKNLVGAELYLPLALLPPLSGKQFYFHEIEGFTAIDTKFGTIGTINYVLDRPTQPLFVVIHGEAEVFIPAIDDFIESIDREAKTIYLACPEGLLDVYR